MDHLNPMDGLVGAHGRPVWDSDLEQRRCTSDAKQHLAEGAEPGSPEARCRRYPIPGGTVCVKHGGGAPQVRQRAYINLLDLYAPANAQVARILLDPEAKHADKIRVWENVLDRIGIPRGVNITRDDVTAAILHALDQEGIDPGD